MIGVVKISLSGNTPTRTEEPLSVFSDFRIEKELMGKFELTLTSHNVPNNPGHSLIDVESEIIVDDFIFKIKQVSETVSYKQVTAISNFFDLNDNYVPNLILSQNSFNTYANFALSGTTYTFTSSVQGIREIPNFGMTNSVALINLICQEYGCEYEIMPNNRIHFSPQIGSVTQDQFRYAYNISSITANFDSSNLKTVIKGYGANDLMVEYVAPTAQLFGRREAEPIRDDRFTIASNLLEYISKEIQPNPETNIEIDIIEGSGSLGDNISLGNTVWLIHEPLGIEYQTRIYSYTQRMVKSDLIISNVQLGNTVTKTLNNIFIDNRLRR